MRCNRFSVSGGVVLPCACSCDYGAFYKRLLLCWLMACGRVGLFRFVACCCAGWRVLLSADGVRMRCIGLLYVDIYIYILLLLAWLVARSRARAVAGGLCVWMYTTNQGLFRVVWWCDLWLYRVYICIYIMRLWWCSVGGGGLFVPCMDISI